MGKIESLDGLRGWAAVLVLWAHFPLVDGGLIFKYFHDFSKAISAGYIGVDIFFALSGFLITRILLREKEKGELSFKLFYVKRSLRIFPLYYLVILLVGITISWKDLGWVATYLSNYYFAFNDFPNAMRHTWSLCVEEHYYLFWPLIIKFLDRDKAYFTIKYIVPIIAIGFAVYYLMFFSNGGELVFRATNVRILTLALGSLLAFKENKIQNKSSAKVALVTITLAILLVCTHFVTNLPFRQFCLFIISSFLSNYILVLILGSSFSNKNKVLLYLFENKLMQFFGKISYGLYLYHLPIFVYLGVSHMQTNNVVTVEKALLLLIISLGIPILSFYIFEKPLLKLKENYTNKFNLQRKSA
jgi:peptidoglycan/LPS O-acetylase OafA/YrhL